MTVCHTLGLNEPFLSMTVCMCFTSHGCPLPVSKHGPKESVATASAKPVEDWKGKSIIGPPWRVVKAKVVHAREHEAICFLL